MTKTISWVLAGVLLVLAVLGGTIATRSSVANWTEAANVGQAAGLVAAVFSALAFGGVLTALWLQRAELRLQREQLELTRGEMKRSADAQEGTLAALEAQAHAMQTTAHVAKLSALVDVYAQQMAAEKWIREMGGHWTPDGVAAQDRVREIVHELELYVKPDETTARNSEEQLQAVAEQFARMKAKK